MESLRRLRKEKLGIKRQLASDYAGVQHIHHIFQRALRRYGQDVALWLQYLDFGMRTNSGKQLGSSFARALSRHPRVPSLWLQAASWEFDRNRNVQAARTLMQRGLRVNQHSKQLWLEYFRLELLYVQKIKARRLVLGLDGGSAQDGEEDGIQAVLRGAVLQTVFGAAVKAIPGDLPFCQQFLDVLDQVFVQSQPDGASLLGTRAKVLTTPPFSDVYTAVLEHMAAAFPDDAVSWLARAQTFTRAPSDAVLELAPVAEAAATAASRAARDAASTGAKPAARKRRRVRNGSAAAAEADTPEVAAPEETEQLAAARVALERGEASALALLSEGLDVVPGSSLSEGFVDFVERQLALPLVDSAQQRKRVHALRSIIVDTCARAKATGKFSVTLALAWVATLQHLGQAAQALEAAKAACDAFPSDPRVWTTHASLLRRVEALGLAAEGDASAGAGAGAGAGADATSAAHHGSKYGAVDALLQKSLAHVSSADAPSIMGPRMEQWLLVGRRPRSVAKVLAKPSAAATGSVTGATVAVEMVDYALATGGLAAARKLYTRLLTAGASLEAFATVMDMELAAFAAAGSGAGSGAASLELVRKVCERAVSVHGAESAGVWERYVELERLAGHHDKAAAIRWRAVNSLRDPEPFLKAQVVGSGKVE